MKLELRNSTSMDKDVITPNLRFREVVLIVGRREYRCSEQEGKLTINKFSRRGNLVMSVEPRAANVIRIK